MRQVWRVEPGSTAVWMKRTRRNSIRRKKEKREGERSKRKKGPGGEGREKERKECMGWGRDKGGKRKEGNYLSKGEDNQVVVYF